MPAVAVGAVALALAGRIDDRASQGALAVALVPAPLLAPGLVGRMRGRADLAGALVLGTLLLSLLVVGGRGALAAGALFTATEAFALAALFASALPAVRDAILSPLAWIGWIAAAGLAVAAVVEAPALDATSALVALALLVAGGGSAAVIAALQRRDIRAAVFGSGLRDPFLAVALASVALAPGSSAVALAYGVFCLVLAALSLRGR